MTLYECIRCARQQRRRPIPEPHCPNPKCRMPMTPVTKEES